ncbi:nitronate monooxygenase family protein [[Clostridium] symbiosum]|uniref:NAD(P)H-dependent flavin oxidoreductase n=1 Tax=Clostridium symbiosum TaxID=1512 RepID=UPI001D07F396|nr:nitronate monooxygenase family protein [[Clostridium] symbiosum]MCB6610554.1 nitronate monooxygenase family protein [[Clostridium] symbiosum]MCB6932705.1 nitronate monooxygenase family protein [[Clostridium] symbiosum]
MCNLKPLKIGELTARLPIIQGGMGVGISLSSLAGAVAKEGGVGIISTAQIGFREPDFAGDSQAANLRAIGTEFKKAREISPDGIIGFNIMVATRNYAEYVKAAVKAGANLIISGAGLPINLPEYVKGSATKIAPIVSSVKSAMVICKMWDRKYKTAPDLVVVEGPLAGGHLGFDRDKLHDLGADTEHAADTFKKAEYDDEIRGIIALVKEYAQKYEKEIPVVTAGGIYSHEDVMYQLELGADGVQVATRFVTTEECDAPMAYKQAYLDAREEDIIIVKSPVGMPGRAIRNHFLKEVEKGKQAITHCYRCLEKCDQAKIPYCITKALVNAVSGDEENALIFCGSNAWRADKIVTVHEVMQELCGSGQAVAVTE